MKFNYFYEKRKLDEYWLKESKLMREAGLTEDEIHQMYLYDVEWFKNCRRFAAHNNLCAFDHMEDSGAALYEEAIEQFFDLEMIDDMKLYFALKKLKPSDYDLLIKRIVYEIPVQIIAEQKGCTSSNISIKLKRILKFLKENC